MKNARTQGEKTAEIENSSPHLYTPFPPHPSFTLTPRSYFYSVPLPLPVISFVYSLTHSTIFKCKLVHFVSSLLKKEGASRLDSRLLRKKYGSHDWPKMRTELESAGFLAVSASYSTSHKKCKTYELRADLLSAEQGKFAQTWRPFKIARPKRQRAQIEALSAPQQYVWECLQKLTLAEGWQNDPTLSEPAREGLGRIARKEWFCVCDRNGRLHTNLSNLKKTARPYLRLNGEPLTGSDYSALHPHLILSMTPAGEERAKLAEWLAGDFYSRLTGTTCETARAKAKLEFNAAVNDEIKFEVRYPIFARFAAEFPQAAEQVRHLKRKDHCNAACVLQRLESKLVFLEVVAACEKRGIAVLSLHDAIYSAPADAEAVRREMVASARRMLGVEIKVKQEAKAA